MPEFGPIRAGRGRGDGRHRLRRAVRRRRRTLAAGLAVAAAALAATATQGRDARTEPTTGPTAGPDAHAPPGPAPAREAGARAGQDRTGGRHGPSGGGRVSAPVRIADAATVRLLRPGDRVDVIASPPDSGPARVVARGARVEAVPEAGAHGSEGALVVLAVARETAVKLAGATVSSRLAVTLC
ncbi:hypothetical protein DVA86_23765 [Streptomyces armeniacus]|uniref:Flp pilus assembly protein RcpC/CpaB domain-containing protein n=1 Tax=Streptomyces armeniacus TaxID=83291 RepID=A0A345XU89_9ACTN|nr:hypothetical protein DVA86_23765 [Streptomyces armeniacus]